MRKIITLSAIITLTACGGHMSKNVSQAQVDKDVAACNYEIHKSSVAAATDDYAAGYREGQLFNECLAQKGYTKTQ